MNVCPPLPTFTFPGVASAMLALSKARRQAYLYRRAAAESGEFSRNPAPAAVAACVTFAQHYETIAARIKSDLDSGIYEGNRR